MKLVRIKLKVTQNINFILNRHFNWTVFDHELIGTKSCHTIHSILFHLILQIRSILSINLQSCARNTIEFYDLQHYVAYETHPSHASYVIAPFVLFPAGCEVNHKKCHFVWFVYQVDLFQEINTFNFVAKRLFPLEIFPMWNDLNRSANDMVK